MSLDDTSHAPHTAPSTSMTSRPPLTILFVDPDRPRSEQLAQAVRATSVVGMAPSALIAVSALRPGSPI